ncbi:hypothetical protein [Pengzhenrongella sicca]|uniref:Uncharacterized protein n=1 Tax=Pengzhenrongella sicca TaxID=2819238 RepID=A0A8A4Z8Q0_9MICO|nr:hypothetical protein [Pengzhenrongella sicca]QTE28300.1 hypothetical protein J4E96_13020 [Pengzhenrongella sicca]
MSTSIFARPGAGADDDVTVLSERASIRQAGLADIPAIARITQEGPAPQDIEPEMLARATRLVLTHLAFEHGSLWVQNGPDGTIARAVAAVPAHKLTREQPAHRHGVPQLSLLGAPGAVPERDALAGPPAGPAAAMVGDLLGELRAVAPGWALAEISKAALNEEGDPALLSAALRWARAHAAEAPGPIVVLADTVPERAAAQWLGFVERRAWAADSTWWLGIDPESTQLVVA